MNYNRFRAIVTRSEPEYIDVDALEEEQLRHALHESLKDSMGQPGMETSHNEQAPEVAASNEAEHTSWHN